MPRSWRPRRKPKPRTANPSDAGSVDTKKGDTKNDTLVIAALNVLLKKNDHEPPTLDDIAGEASANNSDIKGAMRQSAHVFIKRVFTNKHSFDDAWSKGRVEAILLGEQGDACEGHQQYDDGRSSNGGSRRRGRQPSSPQDVD